MLESENINLIKDKVKEELCVRILASFIKADISSLISEQGPEIMKKTFKNSKIAKLVSDDIISSISKPLGDEIECFILTNGKNIVMPMLEEEFEELKEQTPKALLEDLDISKDNLKDILDLIYISFMKQYTKDIVSHIDVSGIIETKLLEMDSKEIEDLSLSVVKRELHYIVLLGALIGIIIGTTNIFI